jgi:hypothetical protein
LKVCEFKTKKRNARKQLFVPEVQFTRPKWLAVVAFVKKEVVSVSGMKAKGDAGHNILTHFIFLKLNIAIYQKKINCKSLSEIMY